MPRKFTRKNLAVGQTIDLNRKLAIPLARTQTDLSTAFMGMIQQAESLPPSIADPISGSTEFAGSSSAPPVSPSIASQAVRDPYEEANATLEQEEERETLKKLFATLPDNPSGRPNQIINSVEKQAFFNALLSAKQELSACPGLFCRFIQALTSGTDGEALVLVKSSLSKTGWAAICIGVGVCLVFGLPLLFIVNPHWLALTTGWQFSLSIGSVISGVVCVAKGRAFLKPVTLPACERATQQLNAIRSQAVH